MLDTGSQWTIEIRPGVVFPDWYVMGSRQAMDALRAILAAFRADDCWRGYSADEDRVRSSILRHYARTGEAPSLNEIASTTEMREETLKRVLRQLRERDLVVMDDERIVGAYPLTDRITDHEVRINGTTVHAMCAVDALGVGAMFREDVEISSSCRHCRTPIAITTRGGGKALETFTPSGTIVWSGIRNSEGCAADTLCTVIAFFCSDEHLDAWRRENHPDIEGYRLSLDEALQLGLDGELFLEQVYDQTIYIDDAIALVQNNIWLGGGLAVLVLLAFLRSLRSVGIISCQRQTVAFTQKSKGGE